MADLRYYATGKRKSAVARVWLYPGDGNMVINGKDFDEYFDVDTARLIAQQPFVVTGTLGKYNVLCTVKGGGKNGQCEALRHGIARALLQANDEFRLSLKKGLQGQGEEKIWSCRGKKEVPVL